MMKVLTPTAKMASVNSSHKHKNVIRILSLGFVTFLLLTSETHGQSIDSSLVYGGSKRGDFKKTILELRRDGTGKFICWLGPHGWGWRDRLKFQWTINNDSLKVKWIDDKPEQMMFSGVVRGKRLLSYSGGPFGIIGTYYLVTKNREKVIEKLKEDGE